MKTVSFEEIGSLIVTFEAERNATEGAVVKMTMNNTVGSCLDGDKVCGVLCKSKDGVASVQIRGFVQVSYSGVLSTGMVGLLADGQGGVKAGDGVQTLVVSVNAMEKTAVIFM